MRISDFWMSHDIKQLTKYVNLSRCLSTLLIGLSWTVLDATVTLAQDSQTQSQPSLVGVGGLIFIIVSISTRKKPIGGWLMLFFLQLFWGTFISVLFTIGAFANYLPSSWQDGRLYFLYLVSTVPVLLATFAQVVVG